MQQVGKMDGEKSFLFYNPVLTDGMISIKWDMVGWSWMMNDESGVWEEDVMII
jgi:hypothetical protein